MTNPHGSAFSMYGQSFTAFDEFINTNNYLSKCDNEDNQFNRIETVNVLEPISVFSTSNLGEHRDRLQQCDNYNHIICNEYSKMNMMPSKSMPHFPNFLFNDSQPETSIENLDWPSTSLSSALSTEIKSREILSTHQFEHTLVAPTSSTIKTNQESLTYLNQGQCYEIKLKSVRGYEQHLFFKSIIKVIFHERRLQYSEKELIEIWKINRPGERIIDIDIPECCGLINVEVDPDSLNSIGFTWSPAKPTGIFVKIQCISTEFTAHKHGGEKGVPLRIKVETYTIFNKVHVRCEKLIHCSSCQVKVFKPKGADRKHKRDAEKLAKLNPIDRSHYLTSESFTRLKEMPLDQHNTLPNFSNGNDIKASPNIISIYKNLQSSLKINLNKFHQATDLTVNVTNDNPMDRDKVTNYRSGCGNESVINIPSYSKDGNSEVYDYTFLTGKNENNTSNKASVNQVNMSEEAARLLWNCIPVVNENSEEHVLSKPKIKEMNRAQLLQWLIIENFSQQSKHFQTFTGIEILCLSQNDLINVCGPAEGVRLYNSLHFSFAKPKLSIYVCFRGISNLYTKYKNFLQKYDNTQKMEECLMSSLSHSTLTPFVKCTNNKDNNYDVHCSFSCHHIHKFPMLRSMSLSSVRVLPYQNPHNNQLSHDPHRNHDIICKPLEQTCIVYDEFNKNVFYPINLDNLTTRNLRDKLSVQFDIPVQHEQQIYFEEFGIQILASDEHVQNIRNHSKFICQVIKCYDSPNMCDILLKILPNERSYFEL